MLHNDDRADTLTVMSNTFSTPNTFLALPTGFGGRVRIHPNGADTIFVDASSNSANGHDDNPLVCYIRYRGKDYTLMANWSRSADGVWFPVTADGFKVSRRASFGMSKAPQTYAVAIIAMVGEALEQWYQANQGQGAVAMAHAAVRAATINETHAEQAVREAREVLAKAETLHTEAIDALTEATDRLAEVVLSQHDR